MIAIAAVDLNWGIGYKGQLLISLPEDQKGVFRKYTSGHTVVYGRKTLETFKDQKLLPKRQNVIMSRNYEFEKEGALILHSANELQDFLDLMAVWYRDVLTYKATQDADQIIYQGEVKSLQKKAASSSYEGLGKIQEAISDARYRLKANASFDWTMELLLVHIKEN